MTKEQEATDRRLNTEHHNDYFDRYAEACIEHCPDLIPRHRADEMWSEAFKDFGL